jgi:DNA mismatch endonuclease (patch repair protein)
VPFKRGHGLTTADRSRLMGRVRQAKTCPEEAVAVWLRAHQLRYRRNVRSLPGRPDFANKRAGFAIFVHGCFWHRHPGCSRATTPSRNRAFWMDKFAANVTRDAARGAELEQAGFRTITVWECEAEVDTVLDERLAPLLAPARGRPPETHRRKPSGEGISVVAARGARAYARGRIEGAGR